MAQITSSQIIFDSSDFTAGFAKNAAIKAVFNNSNQFVANLDPFRDYGVLQPGRKPADATNSSGLAGVLVAAAIKNASVAYGVDGGGKFHEYTFSTNTLTTGSFPYTITGTTPIGQDCIVYKHNSSSTPVFSVFYSYYNTTEWNVGTYVNYTGTPDHDFMSTIPASPLDITSSDGDDTNQRTFMHAMEVGADDILYIGSGRYLHAYDGANGANGTFNAKRLTLPAGFAITGLLKYKDKMLIAGVYSSVSGIPSTTNSASGGEALVYVWNYIDEDITEVISLDDSLVTSIFTWRGNPCVITVGESEGFGALNGTKVKILTGNTAQKLAEFTGTPTLRGVDGSSRVLYINSSGKIYTVGDNVKDGYMVNQIMSNTNTGVGGWIKNVITYGILSSGSNGSSTHSVCKFATSNYATSASYASSYYPVPMPGTMKARTKSVVVEFATTMTSAQGEMSLALSYDTVTGSGSGGVSDQTIISSLNTIATPIQKVYYGTYDSSPFVPFSSICLKVNWTENGANLNVAAPQISRVIINYEHIEI